MVWLFVCVLAFPVMAAEDKPAPAAEAISGESGRDATKMTLHSATGLALPNVPIDADVNLGGARVNTWREGGNTDYLLLDGGVDVAIGSYKFHAEKAAVIVEQRNLPGVQAWGVAIYLDRVKSVGGASVSAEAPRLLVTAVVRGKVKLATDSLHTEAMSGDELVVAARDRVKRYFDFIAHNTAGLPQGPPVVEPEALAKRQERQKDLEQKRTRVEVVQKAKPSGEKPEEPGGEQRLSFRADKFVFEKDKEAGEGYVKVMGNIVLMAPDPKGNRIVTLRADNAVIFTDAEAGVAAAGQSVRADQVKGIYLEDNVSVTDGDYTFRGQRVYYDPKQQRALVLDAVLFAWDPKRQVPLYVRAAELRQQSKGQWSADHATFTTSEFAEPHFAIGVNKVTITQTGDGTKSYHYDAEGVTMRVSDVPIFYWPGMSGDASKVPIEWAEAGFSGRMGAFAKTRWDLFSLLNRNAPTGVEASLLVDGYSKRGPGVGVSSDYDVSNAFGQFDAYYLYDVGKDKPPGREEVEPETENRGRILWRHRHELPDNWEATVELTWLSDPTFLEEFYRSESVTDKEQESLVYLKQQRDDWAFTFLAKYDLLDFVPQEDILQTRGNVLRIPGYTTDKIPEIEYYRVATPLWDNRLTWYSENRGSAMRLNLPNDTPRERGFNNAKAIAVFGMMAGAHFDDALKGVGLDEDTRLRGDTRQEIDAPLQLGIFNVTPYTVGRVTAYDQNFEDYSGNGDNVRLWGALGLKANTSFNRTYDGVDSRLLDVHRLRHVVEPSANIFYAQTNIDQEDLPVYDYDVESLVEGGQVRMGLRNTLQTQRGGEGRWHNVDWLRIDSDVILATDEGFHESLLERFFDYRPENSLAGDHVWNEVAWQATEAVAMVANADYSLDENEVDRWTAGILVDHTPRLTSFVQYRFIHNANFVPTAFPPFRLTDSELIRYGFEYMLTPKYQVGVANSIDLTHDAMRDVVVTVTRRLPRWLVVVTVSVDEIENETSAGIALIPEGIGGRGSPKHNPFLFDRY